MYDISKAMNRHIATSDIDITHHIQRRILLQLRQNGAKTYAQLKPDGLEGNAYNYHLRELKKAGLITQDSDTYHLTATGHLVSDAFSFANSRLMLRPHYYVTPLITQDEYVLVYIPTREPLSGRLCLPSGKLHYGESIEDALAREMQRRNLVGSYVFSELVPLNVRYESAGEVIIHRPGVVWHVQYKGERVSRHTESGKTVWMLWRQASADKQCLPEVSEALAALQSGKKFLLDTTYQL